MNSLQEYMRNMERTWESYDSLNESDVEFLDEHYPILAHAYRSFVVQKHAISHMIHLACNGDL